MELGLDSPLELKALLLKLVDLIPDARDAVMTPEGSLREDLSLMVNGREARFLNGLETIIRDGDTVLLFPQLAGGLEPKTYLVPSPAAPICRESDS